MAEWIEDPQGREEIEKVTKELKLPVWKANHKGKFRDFWNELWDKIEDYILKLKGDTEKNSKGLNDRLVSAVGKHDGDFPIANAVVGNVYYSELTKKYYKCKIGGPAPMPNGNFVDMSILENLNRLENLYKNFEQSGNWYYKQISSNFYMLFTWIPNIPGGESYYDLPFPTTSEYTNSLVLATQTGAGAVRPITCYIKNRKLYFNSQNTTKENYSIFAIVQV